MILKALFFYRKASKINLIISSNSLDNIKHYEINILIYLTTELSAFAFIVKLIKYLQLNYYTFDICLN